MKNPWSLFSLPKGEIDEEVCHGGVFALRRLRRTSGDEQHPSHTDDGHGVLPVPDLLWQRCRRQDIHWQGCLQDPRGSSRTQASPVWNEAGNPRRGRPCRGRHWWRDASGCREGHLPHRSAFPES